jgi:hypothetical protein
LSAPNVELHIPFAFIRVGRRRHQKNRSEPETPGETNIDWCVRALQKLETAAHDMGYK